ncbi:zincin-like metallopeptidase domain-containing protein [Paludisphaera sp.]|uniref:ArdC family protein n=1 Tax=Paludisphaera sp. TaxID=2017432 RepID=UPI00301DBFCA
MHTERADICTRVTSHIVSELERGVRPWLQPWNAEHLAGKITRPLRSTGQPYKGINVIQLWMSAAAQGFAAPLWITFKQAKELGGHIKAGARGTLVVYSDRMTKREATDDGEEVEKDIYFLKGYTVFNAEQTEGLPAHFYATASQQLEPLARCPQERIAAADLFFANTAADIRHGGNRAYYAESPDYVQMPPFECFRDAESYCSTLAHELTHWTKHGSRLNRDFGRRKFGDEGYAREELVAELGAAFLCADLSITPEPREDHASYLDHWLKVLKGDKRAIFSAAAEAQKAVDYLHSFQPKPEA